MTRNSASAGEPAVHERAVARARVPLWLKILYGLFLLVWFPIYWTQHGPANFLWASDIALVLVAISAWSERPLLNSMMAIGVLPFEIAWIVDFLSGARLIGMTGYMFDVERALYLRSLSLFHVFLPPVMIFLLHRLGYDRRALPAQTVLTWVVLLLTYLATDPADNINLVFGPGEAPQTSIHPWLYLGLEMIVLPIAICLPAHQLLKRFYGDG